MTPITRTKKLIAMFAAQGPFAASHVLALRLRDLIVQRKAETLKRFPDLVLNKIGLEIGGPSRNFSGSGIWPIYPYAARLDNCNFSADTVWQGTINDVAPFRPEPGGCEGVQYVREATDLSGLADHSYDFVCSSHALEHVANPLKALSEWRRVLRPGGALVLVLPYKDDAFDHRRPVTPLEHLIDDFEHDVGEDDLTHLEEILALHDLALDPAAGGGDAFRERSLRNAVNRCLHHHVFDADLVASVAVCAGFDILGLELLRPYGIVLTGARAAVSPQPN